MKKFILKSLLLLSLSLFCGCGLIPPKMPIPKEAFMNKSKEEVLEIAFSEEAPRIRALDNTVGIYYSYPRDSSRQGKDLLLYNNNVRFHNIEEARNHKYLMGCDTWMVCGVRGILGDGGQHSWELTFKDGKVEHVRKYVLRDFNVFWLIGWYKAGIYE